MNNKTYKELYEEDVKKIKEWINNSDPFDFSNKYSNGWEYGGLWMSDAINEYINPTLNPNILWEVAEQEIEKLYKNLYHNQSKPEDFITNIGTINATYCFIGEDKVRFYDKNEKLIGCFPRTNFEFIMNDEGGYIYQKNEMIK